MTETAECDVCGADKPSDLVDETTVATIAPLTATICATCRVVQDHTMPDGRCLQCGDELDESGFYIELEFPLGPAEVPAEITGTLCGDCSGWIGCDLNYGGLNNDEAAHEEFMNRLEAEAEQA